MCAMALVDPLSLRARKRTRYGIGSYGFGGIDSVNDLNTAEAQKGMLAGAATGAAMAASAAASIAAACPPCAPYVLVVGTIGGLVIGFLIGLFQEDPKVTARKADEAAHAQQNARTSLDNMLATWPADAIMAFRSTLAYKNLVSMAHQDIYQDPLAFLARQDIRDGLREALRVATISPQNPNGITYGDIALITSVQKKYAEKKASIQAATAELKAGDASASAASATSNAVPIVAGAGVMAVVLYVFRKSIFKI